jgi:hypothetical protein
VTLTASAAWREGEFERLLVTGALGAGAGPLPTFCGSIGPVGCAALAGSFAPGFIDPAKLPFGSATAPRLMTGVLGEVAWLRCPALPG